MKWLDGIIDSSDMSLSKLWETVACCSLWGRKELDTTERLNKNVLPGGGKAWGGSGAPLSALPLVFVKLFQLHQLLLSNFLCPVLFQ